MECDGDDDDDYDCDDETPSSHIYSQKCRYFHCFGNVGRTVRTHCYTCMHAHTHAHMQEHNLKPYHRYTDYTDIIYMRF